MRLLTHSIFLEEMNMKHFVIIFFVMLMSVINPMFAQETEPQTDSSTPSQEEGTIAEEEENQDTDPVTPSTQDESSDTQEEPSITQDPPIIRQEEETEGVSPQTILEEPDVESDMTEPIHVPKEAEVEQPIDEPVTTPPQWQGRRRMFKIVNDFLLKPDETLTTLVLIAGDANIQGTVTGNVLVIGGNVQLTQGGQVQGLLQVIGGQINGNIESIENVKISNHWQMAPAVAHLLMHPHTVWDINKHRRFQLTILKFVILLITYLLIAVVFSRPVNAVSSMLTERPISCILFSFLMFIVIPAIAVVLVLSIVGYPFLLLCTCLLVPLALCGKAAIFLTLGSTLLAGRLKPLAVVFGFIPYFMATEIPHVDWVAFLLFNGMGIGICILSALNAMYQNQTKINWAERVR